MLALKADGQGAVISGKRYMNTTWIYYIKTAGKFIPPMLIYKCKTMTTIAHN